MIGVILAGGRSSRMGTDKAAYAVAGRPMIEWVAEALESVCDRIVVAGREELAGWETLADPGRPHRGPLAGLVAALHALPGRHLAVVSVDQPWVRSETLRRLGEMAGGLAAVPVDEGVRQTTCAVYPPGLVDQAEAELAGGGSLQSLLDVTSFQPVVDWRRFGEDGRSWFSVDTPRAAEEGLARFGLPG
jgi:molybdopterin-guanine dinucleotide biosynthesis protein A